MGAIRYQDQVVRQAKNTSGSDMAKGVIVKMKASPTVPDEIDLEATATGVIYGVTQNAISNGEWGDVVIRGRAEVLAGGTIAAGVRVMPTTGGKSLTATAGNSVLGVAITAGTASALHEVELLGPGGAEMPG
jgi:hypothetical protein